MPPKSKNKIKKSEHSSSKKCKQDSCQQDQIKTSSNTTTLKQPLNWPLISIKSNLQLETIYQNHIVIIPSFFTSKECTNFINYINSTIPLESANPSLIPKKGEAYRDNDRFSIEDIKFSEVLYNSGLNLLVSNWHSTLTKKPVVGLNPNIRIYKYNIGQKFGQHYDDSVQDCLKRLSEWTLLIYLNGGDNENEIPLYGGETVFYKKKGEIVIKPERGMALLHKHGHDCLLHEAKVIKKGFKYVLRSDLMFA
ncbi:12333_t:CDS:2 [Funneliformis caledonium]|uniref:12333_t:CDS:1 n=1 Tax=Funneliformis caledonium TaxID=1117310 RepID=A0A9N9ATN1_9GLOM|nr:12333_t:CDS:2 [Funneliformis caledonium]